jgi:hypothetical protein
MPSGDPQEIKVLPHFLAVDDADVEARRNRRRAAEALFEAMDGGLFDLDLAAGRSLERHPSSPIELA